MKSDTGEAQADEMLDDLRSGCEWIRQLMAKPMDVLVLDEARDSAIDVAKKFEALDQWIRDGYSLPSEWK